MFKSFQVGVVITTILALAWYFFIWFLPRWVVQLLWLSFAGLSWLGLPAYLWNRKHNSN